MRLLAIDRSTNVTSLALATEEGVVGRILEHADVRGADWPVRTHDFLAERGVAFGELDRIFGYYGGIRMLKAVAKLFFEYCMEHGIDFPKKNFTAEYKINVPRLVGLSGSSAICSAMLKALMKF